MTTATRHVETDPLAALREELLNAATRRRRSRRRTRRVLVVVAIVAGLLAATAATAAITNFSTGVPAVDELLDVEGGYGRPDGLPAGPGTEPVRVRIGDGNYDFVAYLNRRGEVVTAYAEPHRGGVRGGGSGGGPRAVDLGRTLDRRGTVLHGSSHGPEQRVYWGYADGSVESIRVTNRGGDWLVKMSPPWTPPVQGARPLRLLVVIDDQDIDVGGDGVQDSELAKLTGELPKLEPVYAK